MDGMVRLVADALELAAPPAKGSDIVVGQECAATNTFLQLLALAARAHHTRRQKQGQGQGQRPCSTNGEGDGLRHQRWAGLSEAQEGSRSRAVTVAASADGARWEEVGFRVRWGGEGEGGGDDEAEGNRRRSAGGSKSRAAGTLSLRPCTPTAVRCRHLRLTSAATGRGKSLTVAPTTAVGTVAGAAAPDETPAAPAFGPGPSTPGNGSAVGNTCTRLNALRVWILGAGAGADRKEPLGAGRAQRVVGAADAGDGENGNGELGRKSGERLARSGG